MKKQGKIISTSDIFAEKSTQGDDQIHVLWSYRIESLIEYFFANSPEVTFIIVERID
jgi:hypothetical protein